MSCTRHKFVVLVCAVLALPAGLSVGADDKKADKGKAPASGTWVRKEGSLKIEFDGKGKMKIAPHGDSKAIAIVCDATEKDGRIKVKVVDFAGEEKEHIEKVKEHVPAGLQFSFKWTIKDDMAKLDDLKGEGDAIEGLKNHLEGDYEKK